MAWRKPGHETLWESALVKRKAGELPLLVLVVLLIGGFFRSLLLLLGLRPSVAGENIADLLDGLLILLRHVRDLGAYILGRLAWFRIGLVPSLIRVRARWSVIVWIVAGLRRRRRLETAQL